MAQGSLPAQLDPLPALTYAPGLSVPAAGRGVTAGQDAGIDGHWREIHASGQGLAFTLPEPARAGTSEVQLGATTGPHGAGPVPIAGSRATTLELRPDLERIGYEPATHALTVTVRPLARPGDLVITLGAGNIQLSCNDIIEQLEQKYEPAKKKSLVRI